MEEDFLAREAAVLGAPFVNPGEISVNHDFAASAQAFPDLNNLGEQDIPPTTGLPSVPSSTQLLDSTADQEEINSFNQSYPDVQSSGNTTNLPTLPANGTSPASENMKNKAEDLEEPQVLIEWRQKQAKQIDEREAIAKQKREKTVQAARQSIDNFYKEYNSQKENNIAINKTEEQEFLTKRGESLAKGTVWDRVCDLIDLQNSQSKTSAKGDLSRFKETLLRLKREGDSAIGASGA